MKKVYRYVLAFAASVAALAACVEAPTEEIVESVPEVTVNFNAESPSTRTAFTDPDGTTYPVVWTANDQNVAIALNYGTQKTAEVVPAADGKTAKFFANFSSSAAAPYVFQLVSPATAVFSFNASNSYIGVEVPTGQTPTAKSVDEAAQILVAVSSSLETIPETVNVGFSHWTAYIKLSLTGLKLEEGTTIEAVSLTSDQPLAGRWYYYPESNSSEVNSGANTITATTASASDIWFACAPVDLSGKHLKVSVKIKKVTGEGGTIFRELDVPNGHKLASGRIACLSLDMSQAEVNGPQVFQRVADILELTEGSEVIFATADAKLNYAMSTTQNASNRGAVGGVVKTNDQITDPAENVEVFKVEKGETEGTYSFRANSTLGFLVGANNSNTLRVSQSKTAEAYWTINVKKDYTEVTNVVSNRMIRYNKSSNLFSTYAANSTVRDSILIFKLIGSGEEGNLLSSGLTISPEDTTLYIGDVLDIQFNVADGYDGEILTTSDTPGVIGFNGDLKLEAYTEGTAKITVEATKTLKYNGAVKTCTVTVRAPQTLPYTESFAGDDLGFFTIENQVLPEGLTYVWGSKPTTSNSVTYEKGSAYSKSTNYQAESWLVSPMIDLTGLAQAFVSFDYLLNYGDAATYNDQFYLKVNDGSDWTEVYVPGLPTVGSSTLFHEGVVDLTSFCGKRVQVAFVYNSLEQESALTIGLKNVRFATSFLSVSPKSYEWEGNGTEPVNITVAVETGGDWTYTPSGMDWATVSKNGDKLVVTPNSANPTSAAREGTVTIKNAADETFTATVSFTQKVGLTTVPYVESFSESLGSFSIMNVDVPSGAPAIWTIDSANNGADKFAKGSAFYNNTQNQVESWLVSPSFDLTEKNAAFLSFEYALNYGDENTYPEQFYLMISADNGENWTPYVHPDPSFSDNPLGLPNKKGWTWYYEEVDLSAFVGNVIKFAFVYNSKGKDSAVTIEIRNLKFTDKFLHVSSVGHTWESSEVDTHDVIVWVETGGDWTYTPSNMDWATIVKEGQHLRVTPNAANTNPSAKQGTIVLKNAADEEIFQNLSFTQKAYVASGVPSPETIVFADLGLENNVQYSDPFNGGNFTVTFGGGSNDGKYYTTGSGIRTYGNGTITVSSASHTISSIAFVWSGNYAPTEDVASPAGYSTATSTWTGSSNSVVLTRPSGSGHWRLQSLTVTYSN